MKSDIGQFNFHWLLASEPQENGPVDDERLSVQRLEYNIAPELGEAWLEKLDLMGGCSLYRAVHRLDKAPPGRLVPMAEVTNCDVEHTFCAQIWLAGTVCHDEYWQGRNSPPVRIWSEAGRDTFRYAKDWNARILIAGGETSEMRSVTIPAPDLRTFLGESNMSELLEKLGLSAQVKTVSHPTPSHLNIPLQEAMSEHHIGPTRRLYAQAKTLQYLVGLFELFCSDDRNSTRSRNEQKICELKEYLLSLEGNTPTLSQLAKDFGLSAKQLNTEFKMKFGQSIYQFITAHRLEQAHVALRESAVPMKVLAGRLGYSHVNHFITAFKRKFGHTPGSLRL